MVKLLSVASDEDYGVMLFGPQVRLPLWQIRRSVYMELPQPDARFRDGRVMSKLRTAMPGMVDTHQTSGIQ